MSASISRDSASARETLYRNVREFLSSQNIAEVETVLLPLNISALESSMFQIGQLHRDEATDRRHRNEFSVLQWSHSNCTPEQVLSNVDSFLMAIFSGEFEPERRTIRQAFIQRLGFDPEELAAADLRQEARRLGLNVSLGEDRLAWLKLMFVHFIEPTLGIDMPLYLTDLPSGWRDTKYDVEVTLNSNVDVFIDGIKVGSVLTDAQNALELPQRHIVFGLDRLLMVILETRQIDKVVSIQ